MSAGKVKIGGLKRSGFVIGAAAFATSIAQIEVIGQLPIRYLLEQHLNVRPEQMSFFFLVSGVAWYVKPIAGLITDSVPLLGTRRRHYLMLGSAAAALCWLLMGIVPRTYSPILLTAVVLNMAMVLASTVMGALLVEEAQKFGATGRLSSLREGAGMFAGALGSLAGGYLATRAYGWTAVTAAAILLSLSGVIFLFVHEKPLTRQETRVWTKARLQLGVLMRSRTLLAAAGLIFLFYMTPGIGTPLYYRQTEALKFQQSFIGWQNVISSMTAILGALAYAHVCKRVKLRPLLVFGIVLGTLGTLLYLGYDSSFSAVVIVAVNGLLGTFGVLPLFDLATRATPKGSEGLGFALMMSLRNFALFSADWIGSWLTQSFHWPFSRLVMLNAGTTLLVLIVIPFLPAALVEKSDENTPARA
jgi:predicted MFS family arabinose efflux permease